MSDSRGDRVVYGRMAKRALDAHRDKPRALEESLDSDHGVLAQEFQRDRQIVEADLSALDRHEYLPGQRIRVNLQAHEERSAWAYARANAPQTLSCDRLVETQQATPEGLVTERVVAESAPALLDHPRRVLLDGR